MSRNKLYDKYLNDLKNYFKNEQDFSKFRLETDKCKSAALNLLQNMHDVYVAKDTDYSENDLPMGNLRESIEMGIEPWKGVLLRIGDKKRRIGSFINKNGFQVKDEAVEDTLVDMANYSLLGAALFTESFPDSRFIDNWIEMSRFCIITKLSYETDKRFWTQEIWPIVLDNYNSLAYFAKTSK